MPENDKRAQLEYDLRQKRIRVNGVVQWREAERLHEIENLHDSGENCLK